MSNSYKEATSFGANPFDLELPCVLDDATLDSIVAEYSLTSPSIDALIKNETGNHRRNQSSDDSFSSYGSGSIPRAQSPSPTLTKTIDDRELVVKVDGYFVESGTKGVKMQKPRLIDPDRWSPYYIYYYYNKPHSNYVGIGDTKIGPIIISVEHPEQVVKKENLRCLVRTKYEDQWVFVPSNSYPKNILKELKQSLDKHSFERDLQVGSVKLTEVKQNEFTKELSAMEARLVPTAYKFGVLYCKKGQTEETQMFSNVETSVEFDEFLTLLGDKIVLKDFQGYRGGLDVKNNTTGTHSIFTKYEGLSIMYHVSTLLPFTKNDDQQIERKRHLGNDVLVIVFKEDDDLPFNPKCVMSEFNHNFIIITPVKSIEPTITHYKMNVITREATKGVEPYLPYPPIFEKGEIFKHFLITKMINCERGAMQAPRFRQRLIQVKEQQMLNAINSVNTSSKQKR